MDLLKAITDRILSIGLFFSDILCPPNQLSVNRIVNKLAFQPSISTYSIDYDRKSNKTIIALKGWSETPELANYYGLNSKTWTVYQSILSYGQQNGLIDAYFAEEDNNERIACIFYSSAKLWNRNKYTIVFSHANAGDIGLLVRYFWYMCRKTGCNIFSYDYSGYGCSTGQPSEQNLYDNIVTAVTSLIIKFKVKPKEIIYVGNSIGTVPTIDLASRHLCAGVILQAPLMSGVRIYFWYSSKTKTKSWDPFPNAEKIGEIDGPVLIIHGTKDSVINIIHGYELFNKCKYPVEPLWLKGIDHNDIRFAKQYYPRIVSFINIDLQVFEYKYKK